MLTYISVLLSGSIDPFWPHVVLIGGSVLAGLAVGAGIVLESPGWSYAKAAVVIGVVVEALCTIFLFIFDEDISRAQLDKIIVLEEQTSARPWTKEQFDAIEAIKGSSVKDAAVIPEPHCIECAFFAEHLELALHLAGVTLYKDPQPPEMSWTGILLYVPPGIDLSDNPLANALGKAALNPMTMRSNPQFSPYKDNVWVIMVGQRFPRFLKFPFEPEGVSGWQYSPLRK